MADRFRSDNEKPKRSGRRRPFGILLLIAAVLAIAAALLLPNDRSRLAADAFAAVPIELLVLIIALAVVPGVLRPLIRWGAALLLAIVLIVKLADMAAFEAMARPFNPVLDAHLLNAVWDLAVGTLGQAAAVGLTISVVLLLVSIIVLSGFLVGITASGVRRHRLAAVIVAGALLLVGWQMPKLYPASQGLHFLTASTSGLMQRHATSLAASLKDLEEFDREASNDPAADIADDVLMSRLGGRDVLLFFVESYGRTVLDNPLYAPSIRPLLAQLDQTVDDQGLHAASGFLTSPVSGGQSWLGHASTLAGLWVDNQRRYNSMLVKNRQTLIDDFNRAGYRTVAVMPAITMAWPEGTALGYDMVYDEPNLGYEGLPFNWVTMPDQYTLAALDRFERLADRDRPLFAEVALISSHAPWTPIPRVIDWATVGDGSIFSEQARDGATPQEVWADPERVRTQFRLSIEYALANLDSYIAERLADEFVLIILGDHQPARIITGETDNRDVPIHIISDDAQIVSDLAVALGFTAGMTPPDDAVAERMSVFRGRVVETLSSPPGTVNDGVAGTRSVGPT